MAFYWIIPFIAILILATCNGAIIASDKRDKIKYSLLFFNSSLVVWACLDILLWVSRVDNEPGIIIEKIMSVSWLSIDFLFLNFIYALLNKKKNWFFYTTMILSFVLVVVSVFTDKIIAGVELEYWGVFPVFGEWMLPALVIVVSPMFYGLILVTKARKTETNPNRRSIYAVIIVAAITTIVIDSTIDVLMPVVFNVRVISMATLGNSLLSAVFLYIINKYRFLELSLEEFSKSIFDKVTEGVIITTTKGKIVMKNNSATELLEKNASDIHKILELKESGDTVIKSKVYDEKVGESTYLNVSNNTIVSRDGRTLRLFLLNDVSELVKFKNILQDKNEEMQITLYRIGHDIKGPANAIKQLVSFAKEDPENATEYFDKIDISIHQLVRFISEVESLIRIKESIPANEKINLKELIKRCWDELDYFRQKINHTFVLELEKDEFISDPMLVYSILLNMMSNAIKYHDIGRKGENRITISSKIKNGIMEMSVCDTGVGMDEVTLNNVFKLFYRGNTSVGGSGLGLYLVKHAVQKLNGTIQIESKLGEGTCFTVKLPQN